MSQPSGLPPKPPKSGGKEDMDSLASQLVIAGMENQRLSEQITTLREEKEELEAGCRERDLLRQRVAVMERAEGFRAHNTDSNFRLTKEVVSLHEQVRNKDEKIKRLESELHLATLAKDDIEKRGNFHEGLLKKLDELRSENIHLHSQVAETKRLAEEVAKLKVDNAKLDRLLDEARKANFDSQDKNISTKNDVALRLASLEEDNAVLRRRVRELLERENDHVHRSQTILELQDKLRKLVEDYEDKQLTITKLMEENTNLKVKAAKVDEYEKSIRKLFEENERITEVLVELRANLKPTDNTGLAIANNDLKLRLEHAKADLDRTELQLKEANERYKTLQASYNVKVSQATQIEVVLAENTRLAEMLTELKNAYSITLKEREELTQTLQQTISREKEHSGDWKSRLASAEEIIESLKQRINELNTTNTILTKDLALYKEKNISIAQLEDELRKANSEKESFKRISDDLKISNTLNIEELSTLRKNLSKFVSVETSLKNTSEENKANLTIIANLESKVKSLQAQVSLKDADIEKLGNDLKRMDETLKAKHISNSEFDKARSIITSLEDKVRMVPELENRIQILSDQNKSLYEANSNLRKDLMDQSRLANSQSAMRTAGAMSVEEARQLRCLVQELDTEHTLLKEREANLKSQLNILQGKLRLMDETESQLNICREEKALIQAEITKILAENKKLKFEIQKEKEEKVLMHSEAEQRKILTHELQIKSSTLAEIEQKVSLLEDEKAKLVPELRRKVQLLTSENEKLQESAVLHEQSSARMRHELEDIREKLRLHLSLESAKQNHGEEIDKLQSLVSELRQKLASKESELSGVVQRQDARVSALEMDKARLKGVEENLRREVTELRNRVSSQEDTITSLKIAERRVAILEDDAARSKDNLAKLKGRSTEAESITLQSIQNEKRAEAAEEEAEILRKRISELVRLMDDLRNINVELEANNRNIPKLEAHIELIEERLRGRDAEIENLRLQKHTTLEEANGILAGERRLEGEMESRMKELVDKIIVLTREKSEIEFANESVRKENLGLREELQAANILLQEIRKQALENKELNTDNHSLELRIGELEVHLETMGTENDLLREKLTEALVELDKMTNIERELKEYRDINSSKDALIREMKNESEYYKQQAAEARSQNSVQANTNSQETVVSLELKQNQLETELVNTRGERDKFKARVEYLERELGQTQRQCDKKLSEMSIVIRSLEHRLSGAKNMHESHEGETRQLFEELEAYRSRVETLESRLAEYQSKLKQAEGLREAESIQLQSTARDRDNLELTYNIETRRLKDKLDRATEDRNHLKSQIDRQHEDLKAKNSDICLLKNKLSTCLDQLERVGKPRVIK
jgi:chromosome segregation ATPase